VALSPDVLKDVLPERQSRCLRVGVELARLEPASSGGSTESCLYAHDDDMAQSVAVRRNRRPRGFTDVMPGTTRETAKGAKWVPKLAM
jgi:hypothetical protein